jgi:hypothetical protein
METVKKIAKYSLIINHFYCDYKLGSSSALLLTHSTYRHSIFSIFKLGEKIEKNKGKLYLPLLSYIIFMYLWNNLENSSMFNFINVNIFSFILYYYIGRINFKERRIDEKWEEKNSGDFVTATIIPNIIVLLLFWTLDFPVQKKGLKWRLLKKNKGVKVYLKIINSFSQHLITNIYWIYRLIKEKEKEKVNTFNGVLISTLLMIIQLSLSIIFYLSSRIRVSENLDNIKYDPNQKYWDIERNILELQKNFSRSFFYQEKYETYSNQAKKFVDSDSLDPDDVQGIEEDKQEKQKKIKTIFNSLIPGITITEELKKFISKNKDLIKQYSGYFPYTFLRIKGGGKNIDIFKNPFVVGVMLTPLIFYNINKLILNTITKN